MSRITLGGLSSGMDTDNMIKELMKAHSMKVDRFKKRNLMNDYRQEEWKKMNAKIYGFYSKELTAFRLKGNLMKHRVSSSNASVADIFASANTASGTHDLEVMQLAKSASTVSAKLLDDTGQPVTEATTMQDLGMVGDELRIKYQGENGEEEIVITAEAGDTLKIFADKIKEQTAGKLDMEANADIKNGYLFLSTRKTGEKQSFTLSGDVATVFGLPTTQIKGQNAKYSYNGIDNMESETNRIEVNGIKAKLNSIGKTNIAIERNSEDTYQQVVSFIKQYNVLVKELQDKESVVISRSQRDMQPLNDEEKKAMSEADVKKWEETLRGRVFKSDKNIRGLLQDMKIVMGTTTVEDNGKYKTLGSLGISIGGVKEGTGAMLFIQGDSELGGKKADMDNKLKEALEQNPEAVIELLSKAANQLSDKMANRMKATGLRTYMSFYDDKALQNERREVEKRIRSMETHLEKLESRYRKQFIAMEKAMAKANSTSSWLSQQFSKM